ncbi:protein SOX-15-like isoform X5 [Zophobas morio]|uniref:protein SOX-15-like isoform X5 n=1 Tax=Zophobas morio TaxID=2755281 RepID=UPI003082CD7F
MNFCIKREFCDANRERARIPRPPNAFMLYANENRKKMSQLYPTESNKDISKRLGSGWKCLDEEERKRFFDRAKAIGLQHKREYPDYVYNPKEARIRKAMRDATRERTSIGTSPMLQRPNARRAPSSHSWVPPPPPPSHDDLMMSNPLAQLQQHAEMWPEYQAMRPRSSVRSAGNPFMMGDVPPYSAQPPEMGTPLMMEKEPTPATSPPTNDPEPDKEQEQEHFLPVFEPDESKMKKPCGDLLHLPLSSQSFRASPSLFSHDINYQNNYILEYFQSMPAMTLINVTTPNGTTFPYATYSPSNLLDNVNNETQVFENITEPIFFHTDVGFVPMSSM